ncbi:MAG TPA: bifunctional DNA-formamidopyrimidine glycosylase/DNA-(apurinic or apyrimidinic site) lyase [Phycisphaerae bacterium]
MPELPEVEEVRRTLAPYLAGVAIAKVRVLRADFVTPRNAPLGKLVGRTLSRTYRHGKKLFLTEGEDSQAGQTLLIHLGMSGRVDCVPADSPVAKHTHVIISLESETDVRLRDPRRFGGLWYYPTFAEALAKETSEMGKDALLMTADDLAHWRSGSGRLKQRLLSQRDVAGLGNIYVDEALWMSKLHPLQLVSRISAEQIGELVEAIHVVLNRSIESGGTTLRDYRNVTDQPGEFARQLQAYGRGGEPCLRCGTRLSSRQVATRTTVFCGVCQRRK